MENTKKEQTPPEISSGSKLRYPLRSSSKPKQDITDARESTVSRRVRSSPSVAQSTSALDLSGKEKSSKPTRRLNATPRTVLTGNVTPISETQLNRSSNVSAKNETPLSGVSTYSSRRKFCALSSVSYWATQIKLAESASKHTISLGFFKLALESGCEPLQRLKEELKLYVLKHNLLTEHEEATKDVLQNFNIELEELKIVEEKLLSNKAEKASSTNAAGNLKPKSLNSSALSVKDSNIRGTVEKKISASTKKTLNFKTNNSNISETQKKAQKSKTDRSNGLAEGKKLAKDAVSAGDHAVCTEEGSLEGKENVEDKESMDSQFVEEAVLNGEN